MENWFPWEHYFYAILNSGIFVMCVFILWGTLRRPHRRRPADEASDASRD